VRRGTASSWTSTKPTLAAGELGFETDTGKFKIGTGSSTWNSLLYAGGGQSSLTTYQYTATGGQTTFSGPDSNSNTLSYTVGAIQVYLNGALLANTADYTASNGTSVVLTAGALVGDSLTILSLATFDVSNTYTQAQTNSLFVPQTGNFFAGKNKVINSDFGIWQRGTSFASGGYTSDRWLNDFAGGAGTVSRQSFTAGTAPVSGYEGTFFLRKSSTTGAQYSTLIQRIEDVRTFAGQTVTLSFWAKGTNPTGNFEANLIQNFGSGGSSDAPLIGQAFTVTGSWVRYTFTFAVPSVSGKTIGTGSYLFTSIYQAASNTSVSTLDIWGVQLEAGSVATAFQTATGTIQGELAACQRYYWRVDNSSLNQPLGTAFYYSATSLNCNLQLPVTMRTSPSIVQTSGTNYFNFIRNGGSDAFNSFTIDQVSPAMVAFYNNTEASGTAGQAGFITLANTSGSLAFSAEL
jgi:hypothetical protein